MITYTDCALIVIICCLGFLSGLICIRIVLGYGR